MSLIITSTAFVQAGKVPRKYTCEGDDISPQLEWSGVPDGTKSLALIVDDPDAPDPAKPQRVYVHWVLFNIPPAAGALAEGASKSELPPGTVQGINDWGKSQYGGPCPPIGRHRYFIKLYALDVNLQLPPVKKQDLERAMRDHILAHTELMGTYQ